MRRFCSNSKKTVEESTELCIFRLKKWGLLNGYHITDLTWTRKFSGKESSATLIVDVTCEQPYVQLKYTITRHRDGSEEKYDYKIQLAKTRCNFGNVRYWFLCPRCGYRAGKLYRRPLGEMYFCRKCNDLTYDSRNESSIGRRGGVGYFLKLHRMVEELNEKAKRQTWRGRPTRTMRRIVELQRQQVITRYPKWFSLR